MLAALAVAGTAIQLYGQYKASKAEQEAAEENARNKQLQSAELRRRAEINADIAFQQGDDALRGASLEASSKGGFSGLSGQYSKLIGNVVRVKEQAEWDATMLDMSAEQSFGQAQAIGEALPWQLAGTALSGGAKSYKAAGGT